MSTLTEITMPSLGADMTEGTLVDWQAKPGDRLSKGDIIALLETQKGLIEMEVYQAGLVTELLLEPVVTVPVGTVMARMRTDQTAGAAKPEHPSALTETAPTVEPAHPPTAPVTSAPASDQRLVASPAAKKEANQRSLNLSQLNGSGPNGAILLRDLPARAKNDQTPLSADPAAAMRSAIAAAMTKSKREIPHYYLSLEVEITELLRWLDQINANRGPETRVLLLAPILKAISLALPKYPSLNGTYQPPDFHPSASANIGTVISLRQGGLVIPTLHRVEQLSVDQVMDKLRDQSERSRRGVLRSSELIGASITVSSLGERGADQLFGVIYPPQVALIGVGRPRKTLKINGDQIEPVDVVTLTLAADHRVSDGMVGAKFLNALASKLQKPDAL